nr:MAG TPA: hypothetical protein [Caudoviricetes sp.]
MSAYWIKISDSKVPLIFTCTELSPIANSPNSPTRSIPRFPFKATSNFSPLIVRISQAFIA